MPSKAGKSINNSIHFRYKGHDPQNVIYHPPELNEVPVMFSFIKRFMGKRKALLKIEDSNWSDPFTLDTIEDAGKVTCKAKSEIYHVGVNINMSKSSLTKIITFTPYFMVFNTTENTILLREIEAVDYEESLVEIGPGQMVPFWPKYGGNHVS